MKISEEWFPFAGDSIVGPTGPKLTALCQPGGSYCHAMTDGH